MAGHTAPSHNLPSTPTADPGPIDRLLEWIRSMFRDIDEATPAPAGTISPPAGAGGPDCARLAALVALYGRGQGRALFVREIQHAGGQEGFRSGGWIGAIVGGITGTGEGASALRECEQQIGRDALHDLADTRRETRQEIRDDRAGCLDACNRAHENHSLVGPRGKPWRECRQACRETARESRREYRAGEGTAAGAWLRTLAP